MIAKIRPGSTIYINGEGYLVTDVEMRDVSHIGVSADVTIRARSRDGESVELSFDPMTLVINEKDLSGLLQLLANG